MHQDSNQWYPIYSVSPEWDSPSSVSSAKKGKRKADGQPLSKKEQKRLKTKLPWSPEEDQILLEAYKQNDGKNWRQIADALPGRTHSQCIHRYSKVLNPVVTKAAWTAEEDNLLSELVRVHGAKNWSSIANSMSGRIGKQCRERWHNHVDPSLYFGPWKPEEDDHILSLQAQYGHKWAVIAKQLNGRSANAIKNHWNSTLYRRCLGGAPHSKKLTKTSHEAGASSSKKNSQKRKKKTPMTPVPDFMHKDDNEDSLVQPTGYEEGIPRYDYVNSLGISAASVTSMFKQEMPPPLEQPLEPLDSYSEYPVDWSLPSAGAPSYPDPITGATGWLLNDESSSSAFTSDLTESPQRQPRQGFSPFSSYKSLVSC